MKEYDWSIFCKRISINKPIEEIHMMIATRDGMEKWFLKKSEFITKDGLVRERNSFVQSGDLYNWLWFGWCDDVNESGEIIDSNGIDMIKFSFAHPAIVTFKLYTELGTSIFEITQENIPIDEENKINKHIGCLEGWTFYLANIKSVMEFGGDLRNKNEELHKVINA